MWGTMRFFLISIIYLSVEYFDINFYNFDFEKRSDYGDSGDFSV